MLNDKVKTLSLGHQTFSITWPADPAVDLEKSDLKQWLEHDNDEALVLKVDEAPSTVTYKTIGSRALTQIQEELLLSQDGKKLAWTVSAAAYSIDSILGVPLRKVRTAAGMKLDDTALDLVFNKGLAVNLPYSIFMNLYAQATKNLYGIQEDKEYDIAITSSLPAVEDDFTFPVELGLYIAVKAVTASTFPRSS